jgi:multiple sugar transport system permease protein
VSEETCKKVVIIAAAAVTVLFCLAPFGYMILTGFSRYADFLSPETTWIPTAANYRDVLVSESLHFTAFMRNSIIVSAASSVISVFFASLAAYAITRLSLPYKLTFMFLILALSMFPPVSLVGYLFKLMKALGWINTYQALILPYVAWTLPLSLWILVSYFARIPQDLDRAGLIDGCGRLQVLFKIIFPVAAPGIIATLLLAFIFAFNEFLFALMLTTDHASRTIPVGIALFEGLHGQIPWGEIMAAATLATMPVVLLALIFQRRIIQGLTRGAVKE